MRIHNLSWLPVVALTACGVAADEAMPVQTTGDGYVLEGELPSGVDLSEVLAQLPAGGFGVVADPGTGEVATIVSTSSPFARDASGEFSVLVGASCPDCIDPTCATPTRTIDITLLQDSGPDGELYTTQTSSVTNYVPTTTTPSSWTSEVGEPVALSTTGQLGACAPFAYYFDVIGEDPVPPEISSILFSEYLEGSSNNKAVEIANTGNVDFALDDCAVRVYANGNSAPNNTINLSGTLAPGEVFLVCHSLLDMDLIGGTCDISTGSLSHNGDDAVELICDGTVYDVIGQIGTDPGTRWGTPPLATVDQNLRRQCGIVYGDTDGSDAFDPADEWTAHGNDNGDSLGLPNVCP